MLNVRVRTGRPDLAVVTGTECGTLRNVTVESEVVTVAWAEARIAPIVPHGGGR